MGPAGCWGMSVTPVQTPNDAPDASPDSMTAPAAAGRAKRLTKGERTVPFIYLGLALVVAVALLPSALRPPQQQPTSSGGFSPDAPPDKNQASVFGSLHQASSGTPGGASSQVNGGPTAPPPTTTTTQPVKLAPSACPYGFGNPPRQVESVYAPACAVAFTGNNGGATAKGITGDSINTCYIMALTGAGTDGPIPTTAQPGESAVTRTYRVLRDYFQSRFQFYGRTLNWFYVAGDSSQASNSAEEERTRAVKADAQDHCFSAIQETDPNSIDELSRRGIYTFTLAQVPEAYFGPRDPYLWSFTPAGSQAVKMGVEYVCKRLTGKPPSYTNDPTFDMTKPRKFGIISIDTPEYVNLGQETAAELKQACGIDAPVVGYDLSGSSSGTAGLASAVTQLRADGVTTIYLLGDLLSTVVFTQTADQDHYFPEWFIPGFGGVDTGHIARDYAKDQWVHAFGFSFYEIPKPDEETECYKAYHEIDPNNDPDNGMCTYMWGDMVQMFGAIQRAGPTLNIQTVKQAMLTEPHLPPDPPWHMAGGYGPGDHTYPDYASEVWWDQNAVGSDGQTGTYRFVDGGKRYTYGEWPAGDSQVFKQGIALSPT